MSIEEKRREAFEESYHKSFGRLPRSWNEPLQKYLEPHAQGAWWAWKTAIGSVLIKLPTQDLYDDPLSAYNAIADCRKSIESAGLKVKP